MLKQSWIYWGFIIIRFRIYQLPLFLGEEKTYQDIKYEFPCPICHSRDKPISINLRKLCASVLLVKHSSSSRMNCLNSDSGGDAEWWNLTNKSGSRQKPNEMTKPETEVVWKCLLPFIIENYFYQLVTYLLLQQLWHNFHVPFLKQLPRWKSFKTTQLIKECANHNSIPV